MGRNQLCCCVRVWLRSIVESDEDGDEDDDADNDEGVWVMGQVLDAVVEECKVRVSKLVAKVDAEHGDVVRLEVRRGLCVCVWRGEYGRLGTDSCCVRLLLGRWAIAALVASRSPAAEHAGQGQAHPGASGRQRGAH